MSRVKKSASIFLAFLLMMTMVFASSAIVFAEDDQAQAEVFEDVSQDAWYYGVVYDIYNAANPNGTKLMSGYADGKTFGPDNPMVRAEFATVLHRLGNDVAVEYESIYPDVPADQFFSEACVWANQNGVILGYEDGTFGTTDKITREQVATILYRFVNEYLGIDVSIAAERGDLEKFSDQADISEFAREALLWATGAEVLFGNPDGTIEPQGDASRAEIAAMISRLLDYLKTAIIYSNIEFDYSENIAAQKAAVKLVPEAADIKLTVADENDATGVVLVPSIDSANTEDYYLNALVAGNNLVFTGDIASAATSADATAALTVENGTVTYAPAAIDTKAVVDEVITFTMTDSTVYKVHTVPETFPTFEVTGSGVADANAGVYTFVVDKFMLRVATDGKLVYYRNMSCVGEELMCEGFAPHVTSDGNFFSMFVELELKFRNANGGFSSGMYVVLDSNYQDIDEVTLYPNSEENHTHGEGYLDQHEFLVMGKDHYMLLSYTEHLVSNITADVEGLKDASTGLDTHQGYVWAGIIQEVKDGQVIQEINTTDYPLLYASAVEKRNYPGSTQDGVEVTVGQATKQSYADGIMDYVHINSVDYTLDADKNVDKILVSMRHQSAVYQFNFKTREIEWILGGKESSLTGYDEYTRERTDDLVGENQNTFNALTFGQHDASYMNKNEDGTMTEDPQISVFDNQTGVAPFLAGELYPGFVTTLTRTFQAVIDQEEGTATISHIINGTDLNKLNSAKYHIASHCGSVQYENANSVLIGWGLHGVIDNIGRFAPEGTISDPASGYADLRQGIRPIFTELDEENNQITFELSVTRNLKLQSSDALFSYRTYKTAE